ncbi:hypothetical protein [Gloeocapsa sp. PCC 73106]|uniref:hypothetical protein n=1 Tax=Gloeocapsa sp. PCC 73106 TaxID=102232 RepID=UPI0002ABEF7C|nr:hypothetical protein [Gloeocapsa sp. PCC 73106]ELR96541.1 hypothetical protein GLO73106DRAFT_00003350 [Gloeocapsa sp. PCC 73106]
MERLEAKGKEENISILYSVTEFDLGDSLIYNKIKLDYELIQKTIIQDGFPSLSGKLGVYIQPRTKGAGHGSISRAFYVRKELLKKILGIE